MMGGGDDGSRLTSSIHHASYCIEVTFTTNYSCMLSYAVMSDSAAGLALCLKEDKQERHEDSAQRGFVKVTRTRH